MFQKWSLNAASIAGAMRRLPCTPQKRKRMRMRLRLQLQLGLSSLNRHDSPSGSIRFLFACGFGHARLRHLFHDARTCRFAKFFLSFLLHRTSIMTSRAKQYSSIQNGANNPRETPPYLGWTSCTGVAAKVKAQAEAGEMDRKRAARITLSQGTKALHTTIA